MRIDSLNFGWLEACIRFSGRVGSIEKTVYGQLFTVSEATTSRHVSSFAECMEHAAGSELFQRSKGKIVGNRLILEAPWRLGEKPVSSRMPPIEEWLRTMMGPERYVECAIRPKKPDPWIVRAVVRAIVDKCPIDITYQSRTAMRKRAISPHALVNVQGRLHVRAFDHHYNRYGDFVLSRIVDVSASPSVNAAYVAASRDDAWIQRVTLSIDARLDLGEATIEAARFDYTLDERYSACATVRKAVAPYLFDEHGVSFERPVTVSWLKP